MRQATLFARANSSSEPPGDADTRLILDGLRLQMAGEGGHNQGL